MAKAKTPVEEKFEKVDFDLFEALAAIDRKDYGYYDRLTDEQKKKFVPFMLIKWFSYVHGSTSLQHYHIASADVRINKYLFNELVQMHPKLQWLMFCSAGIGMSNLRRNWMPQISERVSTYKDKANKEDIKKFMTKAYPGTKDNLISEMSDAYVTEHKKKVYLAEQYPTLKYDEIELLSSLVSNDQIEKHKKDSGY